MKGRQMVLSLSDLSTALWQRRKRFLLVALMMGALGLLLQMRIPIHYTAHALFKSEAPSRRVEITEALEKAFQDLSDRSKEADPLVLFNSWPVMERIVKELSLQGAVAQPYSMGFGKRLWYTLLAEGAHIRYRSGPRPHSLILAGDVPLLDRPLFPDPKPLFALQGVKYEGEIVSTLRLKWENERTFEVFEGSRPLGQGTLGEPFIWSGGTFTLLEREPHGGLKETCLTLIPLPEAVESLQKSLRIRLDAKKPSLIHLTYTHPDRHLATEIVNAALRAYPAYLKAEAEKKINYQLAYLARRHDESLADFDSLLGEHQLLLANYLDERGFLSSEKESEFVTELQLDYQKRLEEIGLQPEEESPPSPTYTLLSRKAAEKLLADLQLDVDKLSLQEARYRDCLDKLKDPAFSLVACARTLSEPALDPFFKQIETVQHKLADPTHYTEREIERLTEELGTERHYLAVRLTDLTTDNHLQQELIGNKIDDLKKTIQQKLRTEYASLERKLKGLSEKTAPFAKKWSSEQKLEMSTQLHRDLALQLAHLIEAKNLTYHMDYLSAEPLEPARAPLLPDPPRLRRFLALGALGGTLLYLALVVVVVARTGPSASRANLEAIGFDVIDSLDDLPFLYDRGQNTLLVHGEELAISLHKKLKKLGEDVVWVELGQKLPRGRALFVVPKTLSAAHTKRLAHAVDAVLWEITDERLEGISDLPTEKTLFLLSPQIRPEPLPLPKLEPILEKLKRQVTSRLGL